MNKLKITIGGDPIAKKRPRFFARQIKGRIIQGVYSEQKEEEQWLRVNIYPQLPQDFEPLKGAVYVHLFFGVRRPKSHYGSGKNRGAVRGSAPKFPVVKPDFDNLEKFAIDCMSGIVFADDKQIVSCRTDIRYSENPRTEILIIELE